MVMKNIHIILSLMLLMVLAPKLWAQPPDLPEGACVTPAVEQCQDPQQTLLKWSEGTSAWPDEACSSQPNESFGDCNTDSCDSANSYAQYVCAANGFDVGIWTGNKQAGCGPGGPGGPVTNGTGNFSLYCAGNTIPCEPFFEDMCAPTDQTQIEVFCCNISRPALASIPAVSELGLIVMAAVLGIVGYMVYRRRKQAA